MDEEIVANLDLLLEFDNVVVEEDFELLESLADLIETSEGQ